MWSRGTMALIMEFKTTCKPANTSRICDGGSGTTRLCVCTLTHWELRRQGEGDEGHERLEGPWHRTPRVCLQTVRWSRRLWWSSPGPHWTTWGRQIGGNRRGVVTKWETVFLEREVIQNKSRTKSCVLFVEAYGGTHSVYLHTLCMFPPCVCVFTFVFLHHCLHWSLTWGQVVH